MCLQAFVEFTSCCTSYMTLGIILNLYIPLVAQTVKRLPTVQETGVQSLGREDPLEKEMAPHSSLLLPGKSHGWRSLVGSSPKGYRELDTTERLHFHFIFLHRESRGDGFINHKW